MKKEIFVCDVCGTEKQTSNHWWKLLTEKTTLVRIPVVITLVPWDAPDDILLRLSHFQLATQQRRVLNSGFIIHLCGPGCVQKKISEFTGSNL